MKSALFMDFAVDKANNTITIQRAFAAELPIVWDSFTKQELLDKWWAPRPWTVRTKTMNFTEGGLWHYAMVSPEGAEHWAVARYKTIEPQKRYTGRDGFADADANVNTSMPQSDWDVSFTGNGDETMVTFLITYQDLAQLEATINMGFREGITMTMEALDEIFAARKK